MTAKFKMTVISSISPYNKISVFAQFIFSSIHLFFGNLQVNSNNQQLKLQRGHRIDVLSHLCKHFSWKKCPHSREALVRDSLPKQIEHGESSVTVFSVLCIAAFLACLLSTFK